MPIRLLLTAIVGACLACTPALAQQAEAAGGPLREAGGSTTAFTMVAGDIPIVRPTTPVEVWQWDFYRTPLTVAGRTWDTAAMRVRIDCQGGTRQILDSEGFLDGEQVLRLTDDGPVERSTPGTQGHRVVQIACEPGFADRRPTHPDHRQARTHMDRYYASHP